jgi:polynucleotide 5'-kinase involved in rRNA processing
MIKNLSKGNTLLAKGPTRITLLEGKVEVFGKVIIPKQKKSESDLDLKEEDVLIIASAKLYPIFALEKSKLEIYTNDEKNLEIIEENSISDKWIEIKDSIIEIIKEKEENYPIKIMVLGISSGKTTLIKYLANNIIAEGFKLGYLDSDLGQQIMFLPTTINIGEIKDYIISSEDIISEDTVFIGATFPKGNYKFILSHSCKELIDNYLSNHKETDVLLIDTDGWIKSEAGIIYKSFFIKTTDPDVIVIFHDDSIEELKLIEEKAADLKKDRKIFLIKEENKYIYNKDKEERRFLRQSQFAKVLEEYRKISIPLRNIQFVKTDYDLERDEILEREINVRNLVNLPYHYVIIALMTEDSELIKVGLLFSINLEKDYILLFSDITYKEQVKVKKILLGSLRLSTKGNHQGYLYL